MIQLFDVPENSHFEWQDSIFRLDRIEDDQATATCIARKNVDGKLYSVQGHPENFNPYANVNIGSLKLLWVPNKA